MDTSSVTTPSSSAVNNVNSAVENNSKPDKTSVLKQVNPKPRASFIYSNKIKVIAIVAVSLFVLGGLAVANWDTIKTSIMQKAEKNNLQQVENSGETTISNPAESAQDSNETESSSTTVTPTQANNNTSTNTDSNTTNQNKLDKTPSLESTVKTIRDKHLITVGYLDKQIVDKLVKNKHAYIYQFLPKVTAETNDTTNLASQYVEFYIGKDKRSIFMYIPMANLHVKLLEETDPVVRIDFSKATSSLVYQVYHSVQRVDDSWVKILKYDLLTAKKQEIYTKKQNYSNNETALSPDGITFVRGIGTITDATKKLIVNLKTNTKTIEQFKAVNLSFLDNNTLCYIENDTNSSWQIIKSHVRCRNLKTKQIMNVLSYDAEIIKFVIKDNYVYAIVDNGKLSNGYKKYSLLLTNTKTRAQTLFEDLDKIEQLVVDPNDKFVIIASRQFDYKNCNCSRSKEQKVKIYKYDMQTNKAKVLKFSEAGGNWWNLLGLSNDGTVLWLENYQFLYNDKTYKRYLYRYDLNQDKLENLYNYIVGSAMFD